MNGHFEIDYGSVTVHALKRNCGDETQSIESSLNIHPDFIRYSITTSSIFNTCERQVPKEDLESVSGIARISVAFGMSPRASDSATFVYGERLSTSDETRRVIPWDHLSL